MGLEEPGLVRRIGMNHGNEEGGGGAMDENMYNISIVKQCIDTPKITAFIPQNGKFI